MRSLAIILILPFLFAACTEKIELDLDQKEKPALVVEGFLTDSSDAPQWIKLTETTGYYETEDPPVNDAEVTVHQGSSSYSFQADASGDSSNYYRAPSGFVPQVGEEFRLEVDHKDSLYTARSKMRPVPSVDSVHLRLEPFQFISGEEVEDTTFQTVVHFDALPSSGDHYLFDLYIDGELVTKSANDKFVTSDEGWNGKVDIAVHSFQSSDVQIGDTLMVQMRSISEECLEFYDIFSDQTELSGNPFAAAPPANIPTNMSGSALGFFQVSSVSTKKLPFDLQTLQNVELPEGFQ